MRRSSRSMIRVLATLVVTAVALSLALTGTSRAASLPGPARFSAGFVDDPAFQSPISSVRGLWLSRAQQLGSTSVRLGVAWNTIAPSSLPSGFNASNPGDPHYDWTTLDAAIRSAAAHGQSVLLAVNRAPSWAEGPNIPSYAQPGSWEPSPRALGQFAHALALRYSGHFPDPLRPGHTLPKVSYFQAWNEPNIPLYLMPQWVRSSTGAILPVSPGIYRSMLNAFYSAVKAVQPHSFVLAAGTAPYGDPPGVNRMTPVVFDREMFCMTPGLRPKSCPDPPHLDAIDNHPYGASPTLPALLPDDVRLPDTGKLWRILHAAERYHRALPAGPKTIWITELAWDTRPPDPQGISAAQQARYLALGFYESWIQGVSHLYWFMIRDPVSPPVSLIGDGLYYADGVAKPAAQAFRFPFVAVTAPHRKVTLWGQAPAAGTVAIDKRAGSRWKQVLRLKTNADGIFYAQRALGLNLVLRARLGARTSPGFATGG